MQATWRLTTSNFLEGSAVDPFNITVRPMTNEVASLFSYWSSVITSGGNAYKLQTLPDRVKSVTPIYAVRDEYLSNALRYDHCLYAISSFVSSRLQHVNKLQLKGLQNPAHYMAKSVGLIRRRLEECGNSDSEVDNPTIGAIALIALADWTSGDLAAARIHLKTLSKLIDLIDFNSPTGSYMIESIRTADFQVAVEGHTKPMLCAVPSFEPLSRERITELKQEIQIAIQKGSIQDAGVASHLGYDLPPPDDILGDLARTLDLRLGWALEKILDTNTFASTLHPIIRNMLDVITIMKAVWRLETAEVKDARYMCRWGRTQGHFLFTYGYNHADDDPTPQVLLTDCVRIALLVVLTLSTNRMGRRAAQRIGYELFEACQRYDFEVSASDVLAGKAYLWALMTAAVAVEDGTFVKYWLLQQAASTALHLDLTSYEDLHEAMTGFLYSWTYSLQTMRDVLIIIEMGGTAEW
jgi:hypothetical protein